MVYLFIGQDSFSKDLKLKKIKEEFLFQGLSDFNFDILYAKELTLLNLQEKILYLPLKAKRRLIVIKEAGDFKKDIRDFIIRYVKKPNPSALLVLDFEHYAAKDEFINGIIKYSQTFHFKESERINTFTLTQRIQSKRPDEALRVLNRLLNAGEKPERILGGLRFAVEKSISSHFATQKKLRLLLNCDLDIKTGRLKPEFALERLVVSLCGFN